MSERCRIGWKGIWGCLLAMAFSSTALAGLTDSMTVCRRLLLNKRAAIDDFAVWAFDNPAFKHVKYPVTLNEIKAGTVLRNEDLAAVQAEGNGQRTGLVEVKAFIRKRNQSLWGSARYEGGLKMGRKWSETSDYHLLYPYVMGDTVGGDLKSECYAFAGGYSHRKGKYTLGVEASYEAVIEHRNADPRPKNLSGKLYISLGAARQINNNYAVGISVLAHKYKQTNDLQFYNELGVPNIYHFTGLGTDYYRFRGAKGSAFYKGRSFGGSIGLIPLHSLQSGWTTTFSYKYFSFDKIISSLNELPMASVGEHQIKGEVAWRKMNNADMGWGIRASVQHNGRTGTEHIFGDATGNFYPQIASVKQFFNRYMRVEAAFYSEWFPFLNRSLSVHPTIGYTTDRTSYVYPSRLMDSKRMDVSVAFRLKCMCRRWLWQGEVGTGYDAVLHTALKLPQEVTEEEALLNRPVYADGAYQAANRIMAHLYARVDYDMKRNYALFLTVRYAFARDIRPSVAHGVDAAVGVAF